MLFRGHQGVHLYLSSSWYRLPFCPIAARGGVSHFAKVPVELYGDMDMHGRLGSEMCISPIICRWGNANSRRDARSGLSLNNIRWRDGTSSYENSSFLLDWYSGNIHIVLPDTSGSLATSDPIFYETQGLTGYYEATYMATMRLLGDTTRCKIKSTRRDLPGLCYSYQKQRETTNDQLAQNTQDLTITSP